jgi:nicotinamidase-related amidase
MLTQENSALLLIDVQEKLIRAMHEKEILLDNVVRLVKGTQALGIPILCSEQNPKGLGETVPEVKDLFADFKPITKFSFSCFGEPAFCAESQACGKKVILACGIESHVCVYQTVADLLESGYGVEVVADAVSSRTPENKRIGLEKSRLLGAQITSVETALFELMRTAQHPKFKEIQKIVK